jgi:hypothetical protein
MRPQNVHYRKVIEDREIVQPTFENNLLRSRTECALFCFLVANCATINILMDGKVRVCQFSSKKETCMEQKEVKIGRGYFMYQTNAVRYGKVCTKGEERARI